MGVFLVAENASKCVSQNWSPTTPAFGKLCASGLAVQLQGLIGREQRSCTNFSNTA